MLKVKIEKESKDDLVQQILETQTFIKEDQIKNLRSENDVWYFDSDEDFEKFAIVSKNYTEEYTREYEIAVITGKVFVVMGGDYKSRVNRRGCVGHQSVQNLGEAFAHRYDITFDGRNLCPDRLLNHREALAVIKEKWAEVCGEYDGPQECYSKWVKTSIRPLIDAVKENYELCARLIIKEYCSVK